MNVRWVVVVPVVAVLVSCASAKLPASALLEVPKREDFPNESMVVLLDETVAQYEPGPAGGPPQRLETTRRRFKLLKPTAPPPLTVGYSRTFTRVESIRMWSYDEKGDGKELDTSKRSDSPAFDGSVLFTDDRAIRVPIPPLPVGSIVETEVVTRDLDVRNFVTAQVFGDTLPVMKSRLVVSAPLAWELRWISQKPGGDGPQPTERIVDGRRELTFEMTKLPAEDRPKRGPPLWLVVPMATVRLEKWFEGNEERRAWKTADRLSNWLSGEYTKQAEITPALEQQVKEVLRDVPDEPEARARALYEFACRSVQYCAIEIGYGGWIPHSAEDVRKGRYGDCKDKATYLHALLKAAGVSSAPTLIYAHDGTPRPFGLPSLGWNFNHAILAVDLPDGRVVYADPTHRTVPFGQLPPSDQEAPVLELRQGGVDVKVTPASAPDANVEHQRYVFRLDANGDADGFVTIEAKGSHALTIKNRLLLGTGKLAEWSKRIMWTTGTHVDELSAKKTGDFADDVELSGALTMRHALLKGSAGDALLRVSNLFVPWVNVVPRARTQPMVWPVAETLRATATFTLPPGSSVGAVPADTEIDSPIGRYSLKWSRTNDSLTVTRELVRKTRTLDSTNFDEANAFSKSVLTADHKAAVLKLVGGAR